MRNRFLYGCLILLVIILGLASRRYAVYLPEFLRKNAGDALWALVVFLFCGFVWRRLPTRTCFVMAMVFSCAIEFSQLYHAPWIDRLRHTLSGRLILGSGFAWSDIGCYLIGILVGVGLELWVFPPIYAKTDRGEA